MSNTKNYIEKMNESEDILTVDDWDNIEMVQAVLPYALKITKLTVPYGNGTDYEVEIERSEYIKFLTDELGLSDEEIKETLDVISNK